MFIYNGWSRIYWYDFVNCLRWRCCSLVFICCNDVERCTTEAVLVYRKKATHIPSGLLVGLLIFLELLVVVGGWQYKDNLMSSSTLIINEQISNTHQLGNVLYTEYFLYFQLSGIILLLAMIGAIILTFRKRDNVKTQSYLKQISRDRSSSVILEEVKFNKGVKVDD